VRTVDAARSFASDTFFRLPVPLPAANVFYYTASAMDGWPYHDRLAVSKAVVHFAAALLAKEFELYLSPAKHLSQTQSANLHAFSRNFEHFGLETRKISRPLRNRPAGSTGARCISWVRALALGGRTPRCQRECHRLNMGK